MIIIIIIDSQQGNSSVLSLTILKSLCFHLCEFRDAESFKKTSDFTQIYKNR